MTDQLKIIWDQTLNIMKQELTKPSFDTWLKDTKATAFSKDCLVVASPNEFARDWVEARYKEALEGALQQVVGHKWEISFMVPDNTEPVTNLPPKPQQSEEEVRSVTLNPKYTFDTFV